MRKSFVVLIVVLLGIPVASGPAGAATEITCPPPTPSPVLQRTDPSLRQLADPLGLRIGTILQKPTDVAQTDLYHSTAGRDFNLIAPGNALKFSFVQPARGVYNFCGGDAVAEFAKAHQMTAHGHVMVWHSQAPPWLEDGNFTRTEMLQILKEHITTVMHHYRDNYPGIFTEWDIVNEAIADCSGPSACGLRNTFWRQKIGDDYIDWAFRYAREADPSVKLYINEYGIEAPNAKLQGLLNVVSGMQSRGVPIDGIGYQFHIGIGAGSQASMSDALQQGANLGLSVAVTELDVGVGITDGPTNPNPTQLGRQAEVYRRVLNACLGQPACTNFTVWGHGDGESWRAPDKPCLFDKNYNPKPAYNALRVGLLSAVSSTARVGESYVREAEGSGMTHIGNGTATNNGWSPWTTGDGVSSIYPLAGSSAYEAVVSAKGTFAGGGWPELELRVDGVPAGRVSVNSATWKKFTIPFSASVGARNLSLIYINDYHAGSQADRNVFIDSLSVGVPIEAEQAHTRNGGQPVPGGWRLSSAGSVVNSYSLDRGGLFDLSLRAQGIIGNGTPTINVTLDGVIVGRASVTSSGYETVTITTAIPAGTFNIGLALENPGGGRAVNLDRFVISATPAAF